ncbi:hypothetical protein J5N97_018970 [Dioscorea zingiberensis]|uniref:HVA22-like protein n=1 Tax=Dioscorea zingiberensis TaxID=325984 RepID=A0A9D5HBZ0_9LILI|nr:hypothetical protein J5N97_018970 [Dioscorea zingiberensis]
MIGSFLTRALAMVLGYAYPAYECYKTVELNRPEIEQLRFWCQYWILVAMLSVFERIGDAFVSWLPMYSEAKLAFFVYLWCPKTRGTTYVYNTFFRPYIAKHETEIDRNLLELRTRAGDILVLYWQKASSYAQTRFFEILQYLASQSQSESQPSRTQSRQQNCPAPSVVATADPQVGVSPPLQQPARTPASPGKVQQQPQAPVKPGGPSPTAPTVQLQTSSAATLPTGSEDVAGPAPTEVEVIEIDHVEESNPAPQDTLMEEPIRVTRGRLRRRAANA